MKSLNINVYATIKKRGLKPYRAVLRRGKNWGGV